MQKKTKVYNSIIELLTEASDSIDEALYDGSGGDAVAHKFITPEERLRVFNIIKESDRKFQQLYSELQRLNGNTHGAVSKFNDLLFKRNADFRAFKNIKVKVGDELKDGISFDDELKTYDTYSYPSMEKAVFGRGRKTRRRRISKTIRRK